MNFILCSVAFFLAAAIVSVRPQAAPQCQGVDLQVSEAKLMNYQECVKEAGVETIEEVPKEKMSCLATCIMKKRNLIDEMGMLHKENVMQAIDEDMPEELKQELNTQFGACMDEHGSKLDAMNPGCLGAELAECLHMAYVNLCKVEVEAE